MLTIRLTRKGKKNQPFFRVVVIDKRRSSKGGRAVEDLGFVDPLAKRRTLNKERAQYWISKGAQPSPTVHNLLVSEKIIEAKKIPLTNISKATKKKMADEVAAAAAAAAAPAPEPVAETPAPEVVAEEKPVEEVK
jgi:small subunit ribosomal protein S16